MNEYHLYIDELGTPDPVDGLSEVYILCGCAIPGYKREDLKIKADQIKFKYWGKTDFAFHSREMGKNFGEFAIFEKAPLVKKSFYNDLLKFLAKAPVIIFSIVIDKKGAQENKWTSEELVKQTAFNVIQNFIAIILGSNNSVGKIIIESASAKKDKFYLEAFNYFLSPKYNGFGVNYKEIQKAITSISFVTKHNMDIEEQIADLFAYGVKCKYDQFRDNKEFEKTSYEARLVNVVNMKAFKKPIHVTPERSAILNEINSFLMLP